MVFSLFQDIRTGKKGQLATLLVVLLVALLIFAFVSVNLGKLGLQRTRTSNATDAAALAAGSVASQLLNSIAGYNAMMLLNMSGFVTTVQLMIVQWIIDFAMVVTHIIATYKAHYAGPVAAALEGELATFAILSLNFTTATILLLIKGATKVGESLERRISELNAKFPEDTRNAARQYAFNNAGIDEPKIDYEDWLKQTGRTDSDDSWKEYLNVETRFGAFMRTLSQTNKNDTNFAAKNLLSFSWDDRRRGGEVSNTVEVYTTPMQELSYAVKDFGDVAQDSSLRSEMNSAIADVELSSAYQSWIQIGITLAPLILVLLQTIRVLMVTLTALLAALLVVSAVQAGSYEACCACCECPYCCCCVTPPCWLFLPGIGAAIGVLGAITAIVQGVTTVYVMQIEPSGIPCLVYGSESNDLTLSAELRRSAIPKSGNLDYGLWRMQYPTVTSFSRARAFGTGGGKLFPPWQDYNAEIISVR